MVCLRGWSFKKVADMGGFLAGCTSACNHLRCYAQQMWRNILIIQFGERKRCWIEWPFSSFSNMNDGIPKTSSCNTVPPRPLHPKNITGKIPRWQVWGFLESNMFRWTEVPMTESEEDHEKSGGKKSLGQGGYRMLFYVKRLHGAWKSCFVDGIPLGAHCSRRGVGKV